MTTESQRAELLALADKATPRPWWEEPYLYDEEGPLPEPEFSGDIYGYDNVDEHIGTIKSQDNAAYAIAACNLAPELAREVGELERRCERLRTYIHTYGDTSGTCKYCGNILHRGCVCHFCRIDPTGEGS